MKDWLSIGQFSKRANVSARALRLYEKIGLIASVARGENGYRYYQESQISIARKIRELKALGFSLAEIKSFLESDAKFDSTTISQFLNRRLDLIVGEEKRLTEQKRQIKSILSSITKKNSALSEQERKYVMRLFEKATIVVTGVEDLEATATYIKDYLSEARQEAKIVSWDGATQIAAGSNPNIVVIHEKNLGGARVKELNPGIVVVKNVGNYSPELITQYLQFYGGVGPHMATVLNADDRASIEIAKSEVVQKGKIYYFSKNAGLKDQIEKIGGIVSDGEEINIFGFNRSKDGLLNIKIREILSHNREVALLAALAAVMDIGMKPENISLTI